MDTQTLKTLDFSDLTQLGRLAAEAMALSQQYDQARLQVYCELAARCNVEMVLRRHEAARQCGRALN